MYVWDNIWVLYDIQTKTLTEVQQQKLQVWDNIWVRRATTTKWMDRMRKNDDR